MVCLCGCGGGVGDAGLECLPLARDVLLGEFVPSWCGVGGSVVSSGMDGFCPFCACGRGLVQQCVGPLPCCRSTLCGGGETRRGCLKQGCVWVLLRRPFGMKLSYGSVPMCFGGIHGVWVQGHVFDMCVLVGGCPVR
ncbi:hypothetical protein ATANTOWER_014302 [Ataeniobius toweri]|uniref:Uncharacterized protein n=1 Tax=Ataeniobius toweri TaxID=208326 RepID=A0ABU7BBG3_9TELE|nr:hypothetical protein [Ataeniobius toweri]